MPKTASKTNIHPTTAIICEVFHKDPALVCQVVVFVVTNVGIKTFENTIATTVKEIIPDITLLAMKSPRINNSMVHGI
jgi:hypothetical protein